MSAQIKNEYLLPSLGINNSKKIYATSKGLFDNEFILNHKELLKEDIQDKSKNDFIFGIEIEKIMKNSVSKTNIIPNIFEENILIRRSKNKKDIGQEKNNFLNLNVDENINEKNY